MSSFPVVPSACRMCVNAPSLPALVRSFLHSLADWLAGFLPEQLMKMKVDTKRHASVVDQKKRDKAVQVVLQGHAVTAKHLSYLIPTGELKNLFSVFTGWYDMSVDRWRKGGRERGRKGERDK